MKDNSIEAYREASKLIDAYKTVYQGYYKYVEAMDKPTLLAPNDIELFDELFGGIIETFEELFMTMGIPHVIETNISKEPF